MGSYSLKNARNGKLLANAFRLLRDDMRRSRVDAPFKFTDSLLGRRRAAASEDTERTALLSEGGGRAFIHSRPGSAEGPPDEEFREHRARHQGRG